VIESFLDMLPPCKKLGLWKWLSNTLALELLDNPTPRVVPLPRLVEPRPLHMDHVKDFRGGFPNNRVTLSFPVFQQVTPF
jgi:hypothetical protein